MSTFKKPLKNPTSNDISKLLFEINWIKNKMNEVREEMKKRPSKIKHLNDLQRQLDHDYTNFTRTDKPQMKPYVYYSKPQIDYPNKKDYITSYVYDKDVVLWSGPTWEKDKAELKEEYPNALIQEVLDEESYKTHRKKYNDESDNLHLEFQHDLFEDYGVSDNPKRFKCFELAWEHGHSSGLEEVYGYFGDLVVLIRDT